MYYQESNIGPHIEWFDRYFYNLKWDEYIFCDEDDPEEDQKMDFQRTLIKYAQIEMHVRNICIIREMIGRYYEQNKAKLSKKHANICTNPRELFTRYKLYRTMVSIKKKERNIGNSELVYFRVIRTIIENWSGCSDGDIDEIKKMSKGILSSRTQCESDLCHKTKRDGKMYICKGCFYVTYCCRKCQKRDWNQYHRHICEKLRVLS